MPYQDDLDPLKEHLKDLTGAERRVLGLVAQGRSDEEIAVGEDMTLAGVRSCLRRFRDRSGLAGRLLTAWDVNHEVCCIQLPVGSGL